MNRRASAYLYRVKDHQLIDERSRAFDRLTAAKIALDPTLVDRARATLDHWLATCSPRVRPALLEWQAALDGSRDELQSLLLGSDERSTRLRQSSPFAGVLSVAERAAILKEFQGRESSAT